jgi:di/tricarboxylate transporter
MYEVAIQANCDPTTFILALMIAVNTAFATPIGAPPNMLVYGPGDLRFTDFMRVGIPLAILVAITGIVTVCMMFPITPLPLHP